jgi:hypothetical protein
VSVPQPIAKGRRDEHGEIGRSGLGEIPQIQRGVLGKLSPEAAQRTRNMLIAKLQR